MLNYKMVTSTDEVFEAHVVTYKDGTGSVSFWKDGEVINPGAQHQELFLCVHSAELPVLRLPLIDDRDVLLPLSARATHGPRLTIEDKEGNVGAESVGRPVLTLILPKKTR